MSTKVLNGDRKSGFLSMLSGTLVSVATTLILILLFAVIIRYTNISNSFIFPVNQVIKIISLFIGMVIILKKNAKNGFFKGILLGLIYFILSNLVFAILQREFTFNLNNLYDLLLTILMGGLIGIIVVNFKKR